jgi:Ca2+-binding RTX toxin-like protein
MIREVQLLDNIDRIGGDDIILGGSGDDRLWGQRGNDTIFGGYGDDEIIGGLGNDRIVGGFGQDTALGDVGMIVRGYGANGKPQLNQDGSWHRDVVLLDTAALVASYQLNQLPQTVFQSNFLDNLLLSGAYNPDGSRVIVNEIWDAQAFAVKAFTSGDDFIDGNGGNDNLYGQGGADTIDGGSGTDTIEGNAGGDYLNGGTGDDLVIGDNSFGAVSYDRDLPKVTHGYQIIEQTAGLGFDLDPAGVIVLPSMTLLPQTSESLLTQMTLLNSGIPSQLLKRNGKQYRSLISLIPSVQDHLDQYAGGDIVADISGRNTLVGDDYRNYQPIRTGNATTDSALDRLTTLLYHTGYDLHDLELALGTGKPGTVLRYGNDQLVGGDGADSIYGDNLTIYSPLMVKVPQDIGKLDREVDDFSQLLRLLNQSVSKRLSGFTQAQTLNTLDIQNDVISGGGGDDYLMGGDSLTFAPVLDGLYYDRTQFWNYNFAPTQKDVRPGFRDWNWQRNNDSLSGDDGNDTLIGGYSNLITPVLTQIPQDAAELGRLQASLSTLVADFKNYFLKDLYNQRYGIAYENRDRSNSMSLENDILNGGNGNDLLLGDNVTTVLPFLAGMPNLNIKIQGNYLDYSEEAYNFFGGLPHRSDLTLRTLADLPIGRDSLFGGGGTDILLGQRGADQLQGGDDYDYLFGGLEGDVLSDSSSDSGANLLRYYTLPSPSDEVEIAPYLQSKLQGWLSTHLTKTLLEILRNRYSPALSGDLTINFGS